MKYNNNYVINGGPRLVARQRKHLSLKMFRRVKKQSGEKKAALWLLSLKILVIGGRLRFLLLFWLCILIHH